MRRRAEAYPFLARGAATGAAALSPILPLTLSLSAVVSVEGLLDTGAAVNVLPFDVGLRLGAAWDRLAYPVRLGGNLATVEAKGLVVTATVGRFPPVKLAFAWTKSGVVPVLLGQVNFFDEFDVCFYRSRGRFKV